MDNVTIPYLNGCPFPFFFFFSRFIVVSLKFQNSTLPIALITYNLMFPEQDIKPHSCSFEDEEHLCQTTLDNWRHSCTMQSKASHLETNTVLTRSLGVKEGWRSLPSIKSKYGFLFIKRQKNQEERWQMRVFSVYVSLFLTLDLNELARLYP